MTATKTKPTPAAAKVAAARAERTAQPKSCTWRGVKLKLPPVLPATVPFDLVAIEGGEDEVTPMLRFLAGLVGDDGLARVREKIAKDNDSVEDLADIFSSLLDEIFGAYAVGLGESSASAGS